LKHKYRSLIICTIVFVFAVNTIPFVLARSRQSYLTSFILKNEIRGEGFSNSIDASNSVSLDATFYALDILNDYGINPHDIETLKNNLENHIENMFGNNEVNLYDLFFLMKSLKILDINHQIDLGLENVIYKFLNGTEQIGGGFSFSNSSKSENLASTYYIFQLYSLIDKPIINLTLHKNWILSCNNNDGGFGGNESLTSTVINTYFAVSILDELDAITELVDTDETLTYLNSFYVNNSADVNSFGGYLPEEISEYALLSSTFFCIKAISLIDVSELNVGATVNWVLAQQAFEDGGFAENSEGYEQKVSSMIASYYAFKTVHELNPSLSSLTAEIWMVEFNYLILIVVLGAIGLGIAAIVFLWRRRRI
jgi:prenyltransferase beta subunit